MQRAPIFTAGDIARILGLRRRTVDAAERAGVLPWRRTAPNGKRGWTARDLRGVIFFERALIDPEPPRRDERADIVAMLLRRAA